MIQSANQAGKPTLYGPAHALLPLAITSALAIGVVGARAQLPPPRPLGAAGPSSTVATTTTEATAVTTITRVHGRRHHVAPSRSMTIVGRANAAALVRPERRRYVNAALVYDYEPAKLYTLDASPRFLTTIALKPGEKLISKAAGDTVRWVMGETRTGSALAPQVLVLLKPVEGGLRTNIVLTTDQHVYLIEATSHDGPYYTSMIAWRYPQDELRDFHAAQAEAAVKALAVSATDANTVVADAVPIANLNFRYKITAAHHRHPRWQPTRVFDDGLKTFIQFPANLASTEAPPLFLIGPHHKAELVNYHVLNGYYVVDRLIDVAELRIGEKPQDVVRIAYDGPRR
jgi:P-type conjugative transfer protein TrbG